MSASSSNESTDEDEVNRNFEIEAQLIVEADTLPKKSAERYMLVYETYQKWKREHRNALSQSEEHNLLVYFKDLSTKLSPSTLWSVYSMLKTTLNSKDNVDISKFNKLRAIIKNNSKDYKPKKSAVLTWDEVIKFVNDAPDHDYLASKVILIFGICGATRCKELKDLRIADVEDLGNKYLVSVNDTKNGLPRQFLIGDIFYKRVKKYISLKPTDFHTERFLIQYHKGSCQRQVIGRNTIGLIPKNIPQYLQLNNPKRYTRHCFRRTSATLLSNSGASTTMLKQLGGCKSTGYVENSLKNRQQIFDNIAHAAISNAQSDTQPSTSRNNATEVINIAKNEETTPTDVNCDNFSEDFEVDDDAIEAIEESIRPEKSKLPTPCFTTGNNKKIILNSNRQSAQATHFMRKPPISVHFGEKENEPPVKRNKVEETETNNRASKSTSVHSATMKDSRIKYDNCVFQTRKKRNVLKEFTVNVEYYTFELQIFIIKHLIY